jgi:hypothetical protein
MNLPRVGDMAAIPLFFLGITYFGNIKNRSTVENILYLFCISGFILDIIFVTRFN